VKLLLAYSTHLEAHNILDFLNCSLTDKDQFYNATFKDQQIDILITGVGISHTTYYLTKYFNKNRPDFALQIGIGGSFDRNIQLGSVVSVNSDCFADIGVEDNNEFISAYSMELIDGNAFPYQENKLVNNFTMNFCDDLVKAEGITVNKVHGNENSIAKIAQRFNTNHLIESMEGASFYYTCIQERVPSLQIRGISNYVEKRNRGNWKIDLAIQNVNEVIKSIIEKI
jgi:futalosine hydrolase